MMYYIIIGYNYDLMKMGGGLAGVAMLMKAFLPELELQQLVLVEEV